MPAGKLRPRKIGFAEAAFEFKVAAASVPKITAEKTLRMLRDSVVAPVSPPATQASAGSFSGQVDPQHIQLHGCSAQSLSPQ